MQESLSYLGCSRSLLVAGPFSRVSRDLAASLLGGSDPAATLDTAVVANYLPRLVLWCAGEFSDVSLHYSKEKREHSCRKSHFMLSLEMQLNKVSVPPQSSQTPCFPHDTLLKNWAFNLSLEMPNMPSKQQAMESALYSLLLQVSVGPILPG